MQTRTSLLVAILAFVAVACGSAAASPSSQPVPSDAPSTAGPTGSPTFTVDLIETVGDDTSIDIYDESGTLTAAESGTPGDGGSVPNGAVQAAALAADPNTIVLTWTSLPCDESPVLTIAADGKTIHIDRQRCDGDTIPVDRVVQLTFDHEIDLTTVSPTITPLD